MNEISKCKGSHEKQVHEKDQNIKMLEDELDYKKNEYESNKKRFQLNIKQLE